MLLMMTQGIRNGTYSYAYDQPREEYANYTKANTNKPPNHRMWDDIAVAYG